MAKFERAWKVKNEGGTEPTNLEPYKEIDEDRASRELANAHGDKALEKLQAKKTLTTRFASYRVVD